MKTINISEATGPALDWLVAKAKGIPLEELYVSGRKPYQSLFRRTRDEDGNLDGKYMTGPDLLFSSKWEAGGPIIEREFITVGPYHGNDGALTGVFQAYIGWDSEALDPLFQCDGPTPLIAAMRCYVASKLGDTAEVPNEVC